MKSAAKQKLAMAQRKLSSSGGAQPVSMASEKQPLMAGYQWPSFGNICRG